MGGIPTGPTPYSVTWTGLRSFCGRQLCRLDMLDALDLLQGEPGRRTLRGAGNRGSGEDQKITHKMVYEPLALHMDQTQTHTLSRGPAHFQAHFWGHSTASWTMWRKKRGRPGIRAAKGCRQNPILCRTEVEPQPCRMAFTLTDQNRSAPQNHENLDWQVSRMRRHGF